MTAQLLDGEKVAGRFKMEVGDRVARLKAMGRSVALATILVGDDGPSAKYVAMKHADCEEFSPIPPVKMMASRPPRTMSWRRWPR